MAGKEDRGRGKIIVLSPATASSPADSQPDGQNEDPVEPQSGCRVMEWHTKTINKDKPCTEGGEKETITDASCYSHSPPDMPLYQYNDYRRRQFDKLAGKQLLRLLNDKVNARERYFTNIHRKYPVDGPLQSMCKIAKLDAHRKGSTARLDESCNCSNRCNCNECVI